MTGVEFVRELFRLDVSDYDFNCRCTTYDMIQLMGSSDELRKRRVVSNHRNDFILQIMLEYAE